MDRGEFVLVAALVLLAAFGLGWLGCWVFHRLTRVTHADMAELDRMAAALHLAEETRDEAITYAQQREAELTGKLAETEAELRAAMEGLRAARWEADDLRDRLERAGG